MRPTTPRGGCKKDGLAGGRPPLLPLLGFLTLLLELRLILLLLGEWRRVRRGRTRRADARITGVGGISCVAATQCSQKRKASPRKAKPTASQHHDCSCLGLMNHQTQLTCTIRATLYTIFVL